MTSEPMKLHAPRTEGDGYYVGRALQWVDTCPHLNHPERTLLRVLTNLTLEYTQVRKITPAALQKMIYVGAVGLGEAPKTISSSGLLRLLRALASLGQITDPDGNPLTFSSGAKAQLNGVSMSIWRYPRHECGYARNSHDALAIVTEGDGPRFGPSGLDITATWPENTSDQAGSKTNQKDELVQKRTSAGSEANQIGSEANQDTQRDLQQAAPPLFSSVFSSSSSGEEGTTPPPDTSVEEDETPSAGTTPSAAASDVMRRTGASAEEADAVLDEIEADIDRRGIKVGPLRRYVHGFDKRDLNRLLRQIRAQRASERRAEASEASGPDAMCGEHHEALPCGACKGAPRPILVTMLKRFGPTRRPDLEQLLSSR
ncbi:hypothetical protein ACFW3Z_25600 [Nocardiopsis alba]|uniref:hypothetical protein n=1 Tax=Nocardiopsis alba TaxID=53437 RepID=UPI0036730A31